MKKSKKACINIFMKSIEEKNEEFVLSILHDIKSPIAGINIALENLDFKDEIISEIYKVNRHNLNYIENLMENYSFKAGKYIIKYEFFNLINLINEEIYALRFLILEKNLKINLITNTGNITLNSDKQIVRQAFLNLITNAVKYSPKSSEIKIEVSKVKSSIIICLSNPLAGNDTLKEQKSTGFGEKIIKDAMLKLNGKIYHTKDRNKICFYMELPSALA